MERHLRSQFPGVSLGLVLLMSAFALGYSLLNSPANETKHPQRNSPAINPSVISEKVLFKGINVNHGNATVYRIPLLTYTPGGHLLVVAEGRINSGDAGLKYIAARRSIDVNGTNWGEEATLHDDTIDGKEHNLGAVLVDDVTKEIYVFFTLCAHTSACNGSAVSSVMYIKSADDGLTWKQPVNVTAQAGPRDFAAGPGYGIQKKTAPFKDRLIVCGHGGMLGTDGVCCLLSDDHGATWRWNAPVFPIPAYSKNIEGDFVPDECQPTELPDGSIMVNVRNQYRYHCHCRIVMTSYDGMETIDMTTIRLDSALIDPAVAASILTHNGVVFFSNPATKLLRINMTLKWSFDNASTWPGSLSIWDLASGYSCLTAYPAAQGADKQKYIFLAFEKGDIHATDSITFIAISLDGTG